MGIYNYQAKIRGINKLRSKGIPEKQAIEIVRQIDKEETEKFEQRLKIIAKQLTKKLKPLKTELLSDAKKKVCDCKHHRQDDSNNSLLYCKEDR